MSFDKFDSANGDSYIHKVISTTMGIGGEVELVTINIETTKRLRISNIGFLVSGYPVKLYATINGIPIQDLNDIFVPFNAWPLQYNGLETFFDISSGIFRLYGINTSAGGVHINGLLQGWLYDIVEHGGR